MGLAASQARLLTITARKSDCEYESMALSHQKIALSRDMNIVSAEYQEAMEQTKLVYDFYGTGDTSTQLSYGLLMQPSKLNDYMPSPVTDPSGRVVLDAGLAAAAQAAGIPQEGLGSTPSSDIRNKFIQGLANNGIITQTVADGVMNVEYNPNTGLGSSDLVTTKTSTVTWSEFVDIMGGVEFDFGDLILDSGGSNLNLYNITTGTVCAEPEDGTTTVSLSDLINGNYALYGLQDDKQELDAYGGRGCVVDKVGSSSFWDQLFEVLASVLDTNDGQAQAALEYAKKQTLSKVESLSTEDSFDISNAANVQVYGKKHSADTTNKDAKEASDDYVGFAYVQNKWKNKYNDGYALNLTNITKAFFTYFAQYMEGLTTSEYSVANEESNCNFVDDNFSFQIVEEVDISGDNLMIANFYDALFNQIAMQGWVQNDQVTDNEYLASMLKNGSMYISTLADDDYYYQGNYAVNQYIKEVTDEEGIAQAEAKYNREKEKINAKENILDMKMKNLDTEISALTTEYDTVKSVISKNIEKAFKRYSA